MDKKCKVRHIFGFFKSIRHHSHRHSVMEKQRERKTRRHYFVNNFMSAVCDWQPCKYRKSESINTEQQSEIRDTDTEIESYVSLHVCTLQACISVCVWSCICKCPHKERNFKYNFPETLKCFFCVYWIVHWCIHVQSILVYEGSDIRGVPLCV